MKKKVFAILICMIAAAIVSLQNPEAIYGDNAFAVKAQADVLPKTVKLKKPSVIYNGNFQSPELIVKDADGNDVDSSKYTFSYPKSCQIVGEYPCIVEFKGEYSGRVQLMYTIRPAGVQLKSVKAGKKAVTVKWQQKKSPVSGYEVQYSTDKKFAKEVTKTKKVNKNKITNVTLSGLRAKKTYYIRIRSYGKAVTAKKKIYSGWSRVKRVKIP